MTKGAIPGKTSWPELLGAPATQAATKIARERPDVAVQVIPAGAPVTPEFNPKRVRVIFDYHGIVVQIPLCA